MKKLLYTFTALALIFNLLYAGTSFALPAAWKEPSFATIRISAISPGSKSQKYLSTEFIELFLPPDFGIATDAYSLIYRNAKGQTRGQINLPVTAPTPEGNYIYLSSIYSPATGDLVYDFGKNGLMATSGSLTLYWQDQPIDSLCWGEAICDSAHSFKGSIKLGKTLISCALHRELNSCQENQAFSLASYDPLMNPNSENSDLPPNNQAAIPSNGADIKTHGTKLVGPATPKTKTCSAGQYFNPSTKRCRKMPRLKFSSKTSKTTRLRSPAKTCKSSHYLDPSTRRCRKRPGATSIKPCRLGYVRNPATGRCRKVKTASKLKACRDGFERNPATNRCRKKSLKNVGAKYKVAAKTQKSSKPINLAAFSVFGVATVLTLGYTSYQMRHQFKACVQKIIHKKPKD